MPNPNPGYLEKKIERLYQSAMNLRDSCQSSINFEPIEMEYQKQYFHAYHLSQDVLLFKRQTREYRNLVRAYKKASLVEPIGATK
jgi:hypothetical protein